MGRPVVVRRVPRWVWVLIIGIAMWLVTAAVAIGTHNQIIVPETLLLGGFVVPTALLFWIVDELGPGDADRGGPRPTTALDPTRVLAAFALGGGLGLLGSALIEDLWTAAWPRVFFFDVAVTEEVVKLAAVWLVALPLAFYLRRDGMLLGAAVGLGFSAFESTGYAFNALVAGRHIGADVLAVQAVRGLLTPVGHALWTSLLAGALFAAARNNRLRMSWSVLGWLILVCALHAAWDISRGLAASAIVVADGGRVTRDLLFGTAYQSLVASQGPTIETISALVQIVISIAGVVLFVRYWRIAGLQARSLGQRVRAQR